MLTILSTLPLLALSGYVTIDGVSADAADGKVTVQVKTSGPVEAGDVRSKFAGGMMQLYLDGGHVKGARAFKSGGLEGSVLKRAEYAKVEVPLAAELGCGGAVAIAAGESGFSASIACKGAASSPSEESASSTSTSTKAEAAAPVKAEAAPVKAETAPVVAAKAEAPVKVEAEKVEAPVKVEAEKPTTSTTTTTSTTAEVKAEQKVAEPIKAAAPVAAAAPAAAPIPAKSGGSAMMFPALVLIGLGGAAYYFKKKQVKKTSMIQILETAQLGPKRQLVVAKVNGETMILGSSEAGITCLSGMFRLPQMGSEGTMSSIFAVPQMQQMAMAQMQQMAPAPAQVPAAQQQFHTFDPPPAAQGSGNEFVDEGGLLTRLFKARGLEKPQEKFDNIELHEFDNLLQESVADQELRRKLSAGHRGKVS